ncbi:uncharacterized protein LOC120359335 [Solenopsis invicta]|uniref:uncharacterized protein LOC120359335 n=1 Tax=Solenopsis invicta TaxID=13686 RepID=UPI00193CA440|nr:uncharacterized protein LOC120359335 [Solenopsis invicta]
MNTMNNKKSTNKSKEKVPPQSSEFECDSEIDVTSGSGENLECRVVIHKNPGPASKTLVSPVSTVEDPTEAGGSALGAATRSQALAIFQTALGGAGRPVTSGDFKDLAKYKQELNEKEDLELELMAEREFTESRIERRKASAAFAASLSSLNITEEEARRVVLMRQMEDAVDTAIKALKEIGDAIIETSREFGALTANEEVQRLERDNASLREEVTHLRAEIAAIKQNLLKRRPQRIVEDPSSDDGGDIERVPQPPRKVKRLTSRGGGESPVASPVRTRGPPVAPSAGQDTAAAPCPPPPVSGDWREELAANIMRQVGGMLRAKPKPAPPPAATKTGKGQKKPQSQPQLAKPTAPALASRGPGGAAECLGDGALSFVEVVKKGRRKKGTTAAPTVPSLTKRQPGGGVAVTNKVAGPSNKNGLPAANVRSAGSTTKKAPTTKTPPPSKPKGKKERKGGKVRPAAVVLTVPPKKINDLPYAEVMKAARSKVDLAALEIDHLRMRRAVTGGIILELPGEESAPKADRLAEKLVAALGESGVRVSRPVPTAEVRVSGFDDSITAAEVAAAITVAGGCAAADILVNGLRPGVGGLRGAWARVPKAAALKAAKSGRLRVGWTMARVELLEARPMQCHRCLEVGHVRNKCPSEVDRSGLCYR